MSLCTSCVLKHELGGKIRLVAREDEPWLRRVDDLCDLSWHIAQARPGSDLQARDQLDSHGVEVHVPMQFGRLRVKREYCIYVEKLLISPYFFVRFHTRSDEEHSIVTEQRAVKWVLTANGKPSPVPARIVQAHKSREYAQQYGVVKKRDKKECPLELNVFYRIVRGPLEGYIGNLTAVDRGIGYLEVDGKMLRPQILDLELIPRKLKAA